MRRTLANDGSLPMVECRRTNSELSVWLNLMATPCVVDSMSASRVVSAMERTMVFVDAMPVAHTTATSASRITVVSALNTKAKDQRLQQRRRIRWRKRAQTESPPL